MTIHYIDIYHLFCNLLKVNFDIHMYLQVKNHPLQ